MPRIDAPRGVYTSPPEAAAAAVEEGPHRQTSPLPPFEGGNTRYPAIPPFRGVPAGRGMFFSHPAFAGRGMFFFAKGVEVDDTKQMKER